MSRPGEGTDRPARIALWGVFDVDDAGQMAARAGIAAELRRTVPGAEVVVRAPLGDLHPLALDEGDAALPLAGVEPSTLAAEADCVVVCGAEIGIAAGHVDRLYGAELRDQAAAGMARLIGGLEAGPPVAWVAVGLAAGARRSGAMRPAAVLDQPTATVAGGGPPLVAHPALLLGTTLDAGRQELRRRFLRAVGWLPDGEDRPLLAVQGDAALLGEREPLLAALRAWCGASGGRVLAVAGGRLAGEAGFADTLEAALGERCHRLPDTLPVHDLAAALAAATAGCLASRAGVAGLAAGLGTGVVGWGADPTLAATLDALGAPASLPAAAAADGLGGRLAAAGRDAGAASARQRLVDLLGAAVTGAAPAAAAVGADETAVRLEEAQRRLDGLERALRDRGRRLLEDRSAYLRLLAEHDEEVRGLRAEMAVLRSELEHTRTTLTTVLGSRTWKLTEPARELAERIRRRRR